MTEVKCPLCDCVYTYEMDDQFVCCECDHKFDPNAKEEKESKVLVVKDSNGTILKDGDSVTIIKTLKVKGANADLKVGMKVKNIRLKDSDHNIDCRLEGFGAISLKSEFVKKN